LLNVVECVSYLLIRIERQSLDVFVQNHEELLPLVGFDDVVDDIVRVLNVHSHHLNCFSSVLDWFHYLFINLLG